jgi:outer membrane receptor protein involved in Fe transport
MTALPVLADENAAQQQLSEIIVTAQKRSERLQDVPVPVTVISGDVLAEQNENRLQDYFASVPGLTLSPVGPGLQSLSLRGVTTSVVGNPTVGVMIDDMPYGSSTLLGFGAVLLPDLDPSDLARVEVLRGPQGTLYGASSLGGLVKFVTTDPSTKGFSGQVQALGSWVENGDGKSGYALRGAINVPLSETFAMRMSGFARRDPGYITNVTTGEKAVNSADVYGGRISALWQPTDKFSIKLAALVQKTEGDGTSAVDADPSLEPIHGDLTQARQLKEGYDSKVQYFTGILRAGLGDLELVSLSAYSKTNFTSIGD